MKKIVILIGASSVGKTSVCKILDQNKQWKWISVECIALDYLEEIIQKAVAEIVPLLKKNFLANMQNVVSHSEKSKLHRIIMFKEKYARRFISNVKVNKRINLFFLLKKRFFDKLHYYCALRKNNETDLFFQQKIIEQLKEVKEEEFIVFDIFPYVKDFASKLKKIFQDINQYFIALGEKSFELIMVFAYCSVEGLIKRLKKRNDDAKKMEMPIELRLGFFPFFQVASLIRGSRKPGADALGSLSKIDLLRAVLKCYDWSDQALLNSGQNKCYVLTKTYQELLDKFCFTQNDSAIWLAPQRNISFDIIIDTSNKTPSQVANELIEKVNKKQ